MDMDGEQIGMFPSIDFMNSLEVESWHEHDDPDDDVPPDEIARRILTRPRGDVVQRSRR